MVREHRIRTAAVNIKMVAQLLAVHRRAFNVPARAPSLRPHGDGNSARPLFDIFKHESIGLRFTSTTSTRARPPEAAQNLTESCP